MNSRSVTPTQRQLGLPTTSSRGRVPEWTITGTPTRRPSVSMRFRVASPASGATTIKPIFSFRAPRSTAVTPVVSLRDRAANPSIVSTEGVVRRRRRFTMSTYKETGAFCPKALPTRSCAFAFSMQARSGQRYAPLPSFVCAESHSILLLRVRMNRRSTRLGRLCRHATHCRTGSSMP